MTAAKPAPTPGYSYRLTIFFAADKHGRKVAYRWSWLAGRAIRISLADAEIMQATGTAAVTCCHPLRCAHA
jgi:hypothetical protein